MLVASNLQQTNLDSSAICAGSKMLNIHVLALITVGQTQYNHLIGTKAPAGSTVVIWLRPVPAGSSGFCYMTLLVSITHLQLKPGNFVDERHNGIRCTSLPALNWRRCSRWAWTLLLALKFVNMTLHTWQQMHLLNLKKLLFETPPWKLLCILALKC